MMNRPDPAPRRMMSHFAVALGVIRIGRRVATVEHVGLSVVARTATQVHVRRTLTTTTNRISHLHAPTVVFAPQVVIAASNQARLNSTQDNGPTASSGAIAGSLERLIQRVERQVVRVERSHMSVVQQRSDQRRSESRSDRKSQSLERAPEMVMARATPASLLPQPTSIPAAQLQTPVHGKPPNASALAQDVLRELDRRVVAERERLGRLS